jgi:hypothetical protein
LLRQDGDRQLASAWDRRRRAGAFASAQIDWTTHAAADLGSTNAFEETDDAPRLRLLRPVPPA